MRIFDISLNKKTNGGFIRLQPEEDEDMYQLYNLVKRDDIVEASTIRNVITETKSGARDKTRIQTTIAIKVETIDFDPDQCGLRLKGINVKENENIKMGQYHTLEIELNRTCNISKEKWDSVELELLEELKDPGKKAEIAVLVMQEGLANLALITSNLTKICSKLSRTIPKKKQGNQGYEKAIEKFHDDMYNAIKRHIDFDIIKVLLVGSPGFLSEEFLNYYYEKATREEDMVLIKNKNKILKGHSSSGYKRAIEEMLGNPEINSQLGDVKAAKEVQALQKFYDTLSVDSDRACYGFTQVKAADDLLAISHLLITDTMYRISDYNERNKYINLMNSVREHGGEVFKFSSLHVSGEQLNLYTGVAGILRFPVPEADESVDDDEDEDDEISKREIMKKQEIDAINESASAFL